MIKAASEVAQRRQATYHRRLCGDCYGVDSIDDYGDVDAYRVPKVHAMNCMSDSDSACHRLMIVAMTSASYGLNYETKDLLKLDICLWILCKLFVRIIVLMIPRQLLRGQRISYLILTEHRKGYLLCLLIGFVIMTAIFEACPTQFALLLLRANWNVKVGGGKKILNRGWFFITQTRARGWKKPKRLIRVEEWRSAKWN